MSPMLIVLLVVVVLAAAVVVYRTRRETDAETLAARNEVTACRRELRQATGTRQHAVEGAERELRRAITTRDTGVRAATARLRTLHDPTGRTVAKYRGVTLHELRIETPHGEGSVAGVTATVSASDDAVSLFLVGPEVEAALRCPPGEAQKAHEFATRVNDAARYATATQHCRPSQIEAAKQALAEAKDTDAVDRCRAQLDAVKADGRLRGPIRAAQADLDEAQARLAELRPQV